VARRLTAAILLFLTVFATALAGPPKVLLVQNLAPTVKDVDPNVIITDYVAQQLDEDGRLSPIVWSPTDPEYRAALDAGKIKAGHETLSREEAFAAAKTLGCDYLMIVNGIGAPGAVLVRAELYRGERRIWLDPEPDANSGVSEERVTELFKSGKISRDDYNLAMKSKGFRHVSVMQNGKFSYTGTVRSVARTWNELLKSGPLHNLTPRTRQQPVEPSPGQLPKIDPELQRPIQLAPLGTPGKPHKVNNDQVFASVKAAVKAGRSQDAILILREAVDAEPLDLARRQALVKQLSDAGYSDLATQEAMRSARVVPDKGAFKLAGAQAALVSKQYDVAQSQALQVLAKEPDSSAAQAVLGEVSLFRGDFVGAVQRLTLAIDKGATSEVYGYRAFARAYSGDGNGAVQDWLLASKGGVNYNLYMPLVNEVAQRNFGAMKTLLPRVAAKAPQDTQALGDEIKGLRIQAESAGKLLATMVAPKDHQKSHARRVLAYQLLAQSLGEVESTLPKADDDAMSDARINFGEALKEWDAALALAKNE
jgi:tetratricopeptide (TPR) repeat protein